MCELFAVNARRPMTLNTSLITFFGDSCMHPHGWGLALRDDEGNIAFAKEPVRADQSALLADILDRPIVASHALAHIRYATVGKVSYDNCHPFVGDDATGRQWALVHNGSVFHQELIARYAQLAHGQSDSEKVFIHLMSWINAAAKIGRADDKGRFETLAAAIAQLTYGNKLNLVLDDGTFTYVHTNTEDDTLYYRHIANGVLICTRPLDEAAWSPVPKRRLVAFKDGEVARMSEPAGGLYHFDEEELKAFLFAHAA